jgi:hypothetical protein
VTRAPRSQRNILACTRSATQGLYPGMCKEIPKMGGQEMSWGKEREGLLSLRS